ncbi:unnamed protein product [Darwinula stevensoni]|uniref:Bifunctional polynucleotide phosphatase/kinase n=1 Tax=Darwinula stevensoni TaxID=69355 RepID=A0A7R9FRH0_9CRUS|nr:unnamed protein product [Darwinula stevensoni]CAG0901649.1 unnamed protein product [Darwinula stevensoni]
MVSDHSSQTVRVRQLGPNPSAMNGEELQRGEARTVGPGSVFEFLPGRFPHRLEFEGRKRKQDDSPESLKRGKQDARSPESLKRGKQDARSPESLKRDKQDDSTESVKRGKQDALSLFSRVGSTGSWKDEEGGALMVYTPPNIQHSEKIAAYDIDGTIIATKSGRVFATDRNDWRILYAEIPGKLKELASRGYKLAFLTNQLGVAKGKVGREELRGKVEAVVGRLGVPVQALVSTGKGRFRKPATGMWEYLEERGNGGIVVDRGKSFYCGDAAGRPADWEPKRKKDFSASDRLFAANLGLPFCTPEEHFLGRKPAPFDPPEFDPKAALESQGPLLDPPDALSGTGTEVIVLVGCPGSGKSHFATHHLEPKGYVHANRDTLGTWQKCVSALEKSLARGKSAVVDNTNPDAASRARYVDAARRAGVPVRCFVLSTKPQQCKHNNRFRELVDDSHEHVNQMVFNMYKSKYEEPSLSEGFSQIVRVNFQPRFDREEDKKLYGMHLL